MAKQGRGRRRLVTLSACLAVFLGATLAWAQWTVVQPGPNAKGQGKSIGLATAFLGTLDASADLAPGSFVRPDEAADGCASECGDVAVKFTSTSPFAIHVTAVTLGNPSDPCVSLTPYQPGGQWPVNVTVPANGTATTVILSAALYMAANAPQSCANTVFDVPITAVTANRV